jgi:hypothetical protein
LRGTKLTNNVQVVRDEDGALHVHVDGVRAEGQRNVQIVQNSDGGLSLVVGFPMSRVVLGEFFTDDAELETKDNVVFGAFGTTAPESSDNLNTVSS